MLGGHEALYIIDKYIIFGSIPKLSRCREVRDS